MSNNICGPRNQCQDLAGRCGEALLSCWHNSLAFAKTHEALLNPVVQILGANIEYRRYNGCCPNKWGLVEFSCISKICESHRDGSISSIHLQYRVPFQR